MRYLIATLITAAFILTWNKAFGETVTTGNLLPNSGDGVDWNSSSTDQINSANSSGYVSNGSTINGFDITCSASQSNCGYRYSVGGDFEVTGTATVSVDDIALTNNSITQSMLDNGITLNSHIDVANCESTEGNCESTGGANDSHTTTVQLEDSSGNVLSTTTQTRTEVTGFQGNCNGYPGTTTTGITTGCGQYNDRIIYLGVGANRVDWSWSGTDSNYTNQSRQGPNLLGSSLTMTYNNTEFSPIDDDSQEAIDDIDETIDDAIDDIDWENDYTWDDNWYEDEYTWEEDFYFEEEYVMDEDIYFEEFEMEEFDIGEFEQPPMLEEFDMEEMPTMEEVFFEEDYIEPPMMTEELFTEEFEEDFTDFIEETGMEEEFMEFLEEEGITAEEFFEEIAEEEFNDEPTAESFEEFEEEFEEIETVEDSPSEIVENTEETMEVESEPELEEEKEVAQNEPEQQEEEVQEEESDSEGTEESEVQSESSEEQDGVQPEGGKEVDTNDRVATDVAKVESKLKQKLKIIAKQIAKVTKVNTQNLSKEDLFFKNNTLDAYNKVQFYKSKEIYTDQNLDLFNQIDLGVYAKDIYTNITLASYTQNDPVEIHRVELYKAQEKTNRLKLELETLRNGG